MGVVLGPEFVGLLRHLGQLLGVRLRQELLLRLLHRALEGQELLLALHYHLPRNQNHAPVLRGMFHTHGDTAATMK